MVRLWPNPPDVIFYRSGMQQRPPNSSQHRRTNTIASATFPIVACKLCDAANGGVDESRPQPGQPRKKGLHRALYRLLCLAGRPELLQAARHCWSQRVRDFVNHGLAQKETPEEVLLR